MYIVKMYTMLRGEKDCQPDFSKTIGDPIRKEAKGKTLLEAMSKAKALQNNANIVVTTGWTIYDVVEE